MAKRNTRNEIAEKRERLAEMRGTSENYLDRLLQAYAAGVSLPDNAEVDSESVAYNLMLTYAPAYKGNAYSKVPGEYLGEYAKDYAGLLRKYDINNNGSADLHGALSADFKRALRAAEIRGALQERAIIRAEILGNAGQVKLNNDAVSLVEFICRNGKEPGLDKRTRAMIGKALRGITSRYVWNLRARLGAIGAQELENAVEVLRKIAPTEEPGEGYVREQAGALLPVRPASKLSSKKPAKSGGGLRLVKSKK